MRNNVVQMGILLQLVLMASAGAQDPSPDKDSLLLQTIRTNAVTLLNGPWFNEATGYLKRDSTSIDTLTIDRKNSTVNIYADERLSCFPARLPVIDSIEKGLMAGAGEVFAGFEVKVFSAGRNIREYVPNYYRSSPKEMDPARSMVKAKRKIPPLVTNLSKPWLAESALYPAHIALWHSHGWYYEPSLNRWEWQRARLFQTVEDLYPMTFTLQMLVPMLENAGANVMIPRERDWQVNEVVVDNDGSSGRSVYVSNNPGGEFSAGTGFAIGTPPYVDENPFTLGSYEEMGSEKQASSSIQWIPDIPEPGSYAVYVSYNASEENADDARYSVFHTGGITEFSVNQRMGGGTWIYLGRFSFDRGVNPEHGKVVLTNVSRKRKARITGDAVRFGGGMGNIARNGMTGLRPRYQEAARYYLQFAGFPDTLVWKLNTPVQDYKDDYQSRGEWVSYLMGAPSGPSGDRGAKGLGIPVDLSFAFHSDAGITGNDTVIGTLGIFSTTYRKGPFPSGLSRMASRDLTDLVQSQIVDDIRALYDPSWTRRALWDKPYSEAFRPNAPAMLLELFSHQNFPDIRFGQEPMFRFHTSRAIYKGMLKFISAMYGTDYVVQPLPVSHFATEIRPDGTIGLSWRPEKDPLESTADPESYRVYTRINQGGFDNGVEVKGTSLAIENTHMDSVYSFRVTALNRGGESFPSEALSLCNLKNSKGRILVISGFDRTGGPACFEDSAHAGFLPMVDQGVPFHEDLHTVGEQFDYLKSSPWLDDDSPGHGASYADLEEKVIPGNTFDFTTVHGTSICSAGYSYVSVSDESVADDSVNLAGFDAVDFIAGEEKTSFFPKNDSLPMYQVFPDTLLHRLQDYLESGGNLFVSGAHIASDVHFNRQDTAVARMMKYRWRTSNASRLGGFYFMDPAFGAYTTTFRFNTGYHPRVYTVEGADALEPADTTSMTLARYRENNMSAAVSYRGKYGIVAMGFPFETILGSQARDEIMRQILVFLTWQNEDE
ncbi:MAG: hypothetical protein V2B15_06840 [Bacteroidota bacterium]